MIARSVLLCCCLVLTLLGASSVAWAQAASCVLPPRLDDWRFETRGGGDPRAPVDSYLLSLSWSPAFCARTASRAGQPDHDHQCEDNSFGFVVHGLWPNWSKARSVDDQPGYCRPSRRLDPALVRAQMCRMPGASLVQHQWSKHGVCAFRTPEDYFARIDALTRALRLPDMARFEGQRPTVGALRTAFVRLNPGLPANAIMVDLDRRGRLDEVRLCYDLRWRWSACPRRGAPNHLTFDFDRRR